MPIGSRHHAKVCVIELDKSKLRKDTTMATTLTPVGAPPTSRITGIPPHIAKPESIESSLCALEFRDGGSRDVAY